MAPSRKRQKQLSPDEAGGVKINRTLEFEQWLEIHNGSLPKSMEIRSFDCIGNGVFTHTEIVDTILEIPLSIVLSEDKVAASAEGRAFDKVVASPLSPRGKFYCFLIAQRNQTTSFFGPYLRSLPLQYTTPFYWSPEELQWLEGTTLRNTVQSTLSSLTDEFNAYFPLLSDAFPELFASVKFEDYLWAHCTYTSRGFPAQVGNSTGTLGCLLPVVDLLNHRHLTPIEWNTTDSKIVIKHCGKTSIAGNQQVFNNYGAKSNGEFLLGYGFCLENNFDHDRVVVTVGISTQDPLYTPKMKALEGLERQCILNALQISSELQQVMRIAVMDESELQQLQLNPQSSLEYINVENELNMMESLEQLISHSLQKNSLVQIRDESTNAQNAMLYRNGQQHIFEMYLNKLLPEYRQQVILQHAEEFAPYLEEHF